MPIAKFQLPDGRIARFEVPAGTTPEQAERMMSQYFAGPARGEEKAAQPERIPGIVESGVAGAKKMLSSQRTALESLLGAEEAAQAGLARSEALEKKTPSALSLERVKEKYAKDGVLSAAGEVLRQAPSFITEQLPQLGAAYTGGRLGAMAGAPLGPGGALAGGIAGALAPMALQAYGAGAERRAAEGLPQAPGKTAVSALGQAGLETAAMVIPFGGKLMGRILGLPVKEAEQALLSPAARKLAEERLATSIAKGTAKGLLAEIPTEVGQQMLERWQANLPLMDDNALKEYSEAAYGASLFGAPFGGVGRRAQVGAAKEEVTRADALEAAKQAKELQEAEAAKKADPNYMLEVGDKFEALQQQEKDLLAARGKKPGKNATFEQKELFAQQTEELQTVRNQLKELAPEYREIKSKLAGLREERGAVATPEAPAAPAAPTAPVVQPNVQQMMDQYREAQKSLAPLEAQMQEAAANGDTAAINQLVPAYQQQQAQLQELGAQIEALGGTTKAPEVFESEAAKAEKELNKKIKAAQKKLADAATLGDFDAMPSLAAKLDELRAQQAEQQAVLEQQREALRINAVPVGETIPMFPGEAAPQTTEVVTEAAEKKKSAAIAQREKVLAQRQQELAELAQIDTEGFGVDEFGVPNKPFDAYQRSEYKRRLYEKGQEVEQLQNELANLQKEKPSDITLDLFSDFNLLNTAIQNRDERTIARMQRAREDADRKALAAASSKRSPREEVYEILKDKINKIVRRERNYDVYDVTINNERRQVYVSDAVAQEIADLRNTVEKPIGNAKRSMLQIAHDDYAIYEKRLARLEEAKAAKASADKITTLKSQVATALRNYTKSVNRIKPYRDKLDAAMAKLYKTTEVATPRQKAAETAALGKSARETSAQVKQAKKIAEGKVKVSEAKVAQELGETMDEYQAFAAPYQKRLQTKVDQFNKFITTANERLAKLKETLVDAKEVAAVEKQLNAATKARDAIPAEDVIEKAKAEKKVNSLKEHLRVVKTPKEDKYKLAEANLVKIAKDRRAELERLKDELTKAVAEKAVALGKQHPDFKKKLAEAKEAYQESLQDSVQETKSLRTPQVTRKVAKLGEMRTSSTESKSATQRRQEAFEAGLSEAKGEAFDYQQRQEARERTQKARAAKEAKGTAMQVAMTKAAQEKVIKEVEAREKEQGKFARGVEVESPDLSREQIKMLEANNVTGVLRSIANDPKASELNRVVAARLAGMLDATDVVLKDKLFAPDGKEVLGEAISTQIQLSRNGGLSQEVLLHEATHSAVERVIQMPDSMLTKEQIIAKRELNALYNSVKNDKSITSSNAKSSLSEFAAEVFSNENLQNQLRNKKWKLSNAWAGIKSIIMRMLGVKNPETMLGAALQSVDALMIPSSSKIGRVEKPVNRKYSQKDIAALHTGSNSMKQFAEQFGPEIKQKDRTPEDVDRIAVKYLNDMSSSPEKSIPQVDAGALNFASFTRMPDGRQYDATSVDDFFTADPQIIAYKSMDMSDWIQEANDVSKKRVSDFTALVDYLVLNQDYTLAEQALVAKAASKYSVIADKNGRLKLVTISDDNLHPVAVIGHDSANVIIEELRAGKGLKDAFIDGLQKRADRNKQLNLGKQGWKKFAQADDYDAAVALNAGAAGTSWCTAKDVGTAKGQLQGGDFYIYYDNGRPEVAIRMDGKNVIGEIRGNTSNQSVSDEQQKIATAFLKKKNFAGAQEYLNDVEFRSVMLDAIKTGKTLTPEQTIRFFGRAESSTKERMAETIAYPHETFTRGFLEASSLFGYGTVIEDKVVKEVDKVFARSAAEAYSNGYFFMDDMDFVYSGSEGVVVFDLPTTHMTGSKRKEFKDKFERDIRATAKMMANSGDKAAVINGKRLLLISTETPAQKEERIYNALNRAGDINFRNPNAFVKFVIPLKDVKALSEISFAGKTNVELPQLVHVDTISFGSTDEALILPKVKNINEVFVGGRHTPNTQTGENIPILAVEDGTQIKKIAPQAQDRMLLLSGDAFIHNLELAGGANRNTLSLVAPDITRIGRVTNEPNTYRTASDVIDALNSILPDFARSAQRWVALKKDGSFATASEDSGAAKAVQSYGEDSFNAAAAPMSKLAKELYKLMSPTDTARFNEIFNRRIEGQIRFAENENDLQLGIDTSTDADGFLRLQVKVLLDNRDTEAANKNIEKIKNVLRSLGVEESEIGLDAIKVGELTAPELKQDEDVVDAEYVEVPERPRYAPKDDSVGPHKTKDGWGFRTEQSSSRYGKSFVATEKNAKDKLVGNLLGLSGRVQFVDQYAALDAAIKKGLDAGVISDLEAEQAGYYLRFGQQANAYATQALTNGPLSLVKQATKRGMEFVYKSTPGANMTKVAQALEKSGIKNSTELEQMFTIYVAGKRAKQVGWNKLNFSNPAAVEQDYNRLMAELKGNSKARAAFEEAAKIYKEYNNGLIDFLVQTGYMNAGRAAELKAIDYVPFYRVQGGELQLMVDKEQPVRIANIKDEPMLHELVGDNTQILPIFTSSAQNAFVLTRMGLRNQMMKDNAMLLARLGIASKIGTGKGPQGPNTVRYKVKGVDNFAVIDTNMYGIPADLIVKGMEGIKTTIPMAIKIMGLPANWLRKFVTRNPAYAIRQAIRDPLTAWFTTGVDGVPVMNSMKELSKMVAGRSKEEAELMRAGAISSNVMTGDEQDMARAMRDMSLGRTGWSKLMMKADALAMQGDAATRAVIYKDSLNKGMSEMQALLRTLESMNFSRRGLSPSVQMMSTLIPFFNAQIQGLDVLYRAFKGQMPYSEQLKIRQKLYTRGLLLAAGTLAYAAAMEDDEAYKRAKPEERLGNWFVYTPFSDEPMKVPIPFELGYLFKALPEAVFNMAAKDERADDITKGMGKLLGLSNPFALPAAIKPVTEVILGKSFFGGDIESMREKTTMMPGERYREGTTEIAKVLGSVTGDAGLTPIKIDYLIRGYTGALGVAIASLANPILNTEASTVEKPTMKTSKMPFIGGLFQPVEGRGTLDAAYERMLEIQQVQGTFDRLVSSGKREEAKAFVEKYGNKLAMASLSSGIQQDLGEFAQMRRQVLESNKTTAEKDALLKRIDNAQYQLASKFLSVTGETRPQ